MKDMKGKKDIKKDMMEKKKGYETDKGSKPKMPGMKKKGK